MTSIRLLFGAFCPSPQSCGNSHTPSSLDKNHSKISRPRFNISYETRSKVHLFNPENDLALASGKTHYTAPKAAMRLRQSGAAIPLWYAEPDDRVLCHGVDRHWLEQVRDRFMIQADIFDHKPQDGQRPEPWGWSAAVKREFADAGFTAAALPTDAEICKMRELSHRRTGAAVARRVAQLLPDIMLPPAASEIRDMAEAEEYMRRFGGKVFFKAPWSCSGRGVTDSRICGTDASLHRVAGYIRSQGSAMAEPALDKAVDFAKIYECRGGEARLTGTSVFATDNRGTYCGNLLADERTRVSVTEKYADATELRRVTKAVRIALGEIVAPYYSGIVGVDMLVDRRGIICPVVEVNLRKTMGYVANCFADRYLAEGARGRFVVAPANTWPAPDGYSAEHGRLLGGKVSLVPPGGTFSITAEIE